MTKKKEWYKIVEIGSEDAFLNNTSKKVPKEGDIVEKMYVMLDEFNTNLSYFANGFIAAKLRRKYSRRGWNFYHVKIERVQS